MNNKVFLNLFLQGLKAVVGQINLQDLIDKLIQAISGQATAGGQPAKLVISDDGLKLIGPNGEDLTQHPLHFTFKVD